MLFFIPLWFKIVVIDDSLSEGFLMDQIKVIAIDDVIDILEIYKSIFDELPDFDIRCFNNPLEVTLEDFKWCDVVICDFKMPGVTGAEVLENMYSSGLEVPFVFVTAFEAELSKSLRFSSLTHTLTKPFTPNELIECARAFGQFHKEWEAQLIKLFSSTDFQNLNSSEFLELIRKSKSIKFIRGLNVLNSLSKK